MVHGELGSPPCEVMTGAGACTASMAAFKYAAMAVSAGLTPHAVVTGSELCSALMQAKWIGPELDERLQSLEKNPHLAFEHEFLRWMLSDGAGAWLVEPQPREHGLVRPLKIQWIESVSFAGSLDVCMYHLARKRDDGRLQTWKEVEPAEWLEGGFFRMGQDARMLGEHIGPFMGDALKIAVDRRGLKPSDVHWLLPHISSDFFRPQILEQTSRAGIPIPAERVFMNLSSVGNVGAAAVFLMLDELMRSGRAKKGENLLCIIPESARFNASFVFLEVL
jgi:3-oxoacyl-[acyl-carrier-protein] synthase-3